MVRIRRPVRLALIGCGEVTRAKHLPALARVAEASVAAVCDADEGRCRKVAAQFGIGRHCRDVNELFAMPDLDAVGVCTNPGTHLPLAVAAMQAGKHIYIEEPLALTPADCARLIDEARGAQVIAMAGFHMRFHRLVAEAHACLRRGLVGSVESVRVVWHSPRDDVGIAAWRTQRTLGGGALFEIAVHHLDLLRSLLGTEFEEIHAMSRDGVRQDECAVLLARMTDGTLVTGEFSERSPHEIEITVSGSGGSLRIDCLKFDGLQWRGGWEVPGAPGVRLRSVGRFLSSFPAGIRSMRRGGDYLISYENAWRHFAGRVGAGTTPAATLQDGLRAVEAVCAAVESVATSRPVRVAQKEPPGE